MCSILLRHRPEPNPSMPRASANSARWLPTKPVIPVIKIRIVAIVLHPARRAAHTRCPTKGSPPGARQGQRREGPKGEDSAPPWVVVAPHGAPAHPRFGPQPVVVADGRDAPRREPPDHEGLGQVRQAGHARQTHPEVVILRDWER